MADELDKAVERFHELMKDKVAKSPNRYDWLDAAYMVALEQSGQLGGPLWPEFVERVSRSDA